jgi:hypothetical protein
MSIAAHHAEWLSLLDVSGPFLSVPVLRAALPSGLDSHDSLRAADLRAALEQLEAAELDGDPDAAQLRHAFIHFVLDRILGFDDDVLVRDPAVLQRHAVEVEQHGVTLTPDAVVLDGDQLRMLVTVVDPPDLVDQPIVGAAWAAAPRDRMVEHLAALDCRLGLVTDGERWTLVSHREGENPGFATWWASLWREERLTLQAFRTLLGQARFLTVPDGGRAAGGDYVLEQDETLEGLLDRSMEDQREITTKLGAQTLDAVEILIRAIDQIDRDRGGALLADVDEGELYDAAVTVMMRLIFLFFAEENELLPMQEPLYATEYAASTLRARLQATADRFGEEVMAESTDAWARLLSTWRTVHAGAQHADMVVAPYGGSLLDPDRYPFLEGRAPGTIWHDTPADPLPIDNRTVLHILGALQTLDERGLRRRLSFRALDVEQIGHVYEGMLDHTAVRSDDWVLGLSGTGGKAPELTLSHLESFGTDGELAAFLKDATGRSAPTLKKWLLEDPQLTIDQAFPTTWVAAFGGDVAMAERAARFAKLVRQNSNGGPTVFAPGSIYVSDSAHRGATGTHYTPRSLSDEVVRHTLDPLVYVGPAEGLPESEWTMRAPEEILDLKVCDPACGSGAFLVQTVRYLADKLVESRRLSGHDGRSSEGDVVEARRLVAERCVHGVDVNPMACEMAKLSLWLVTLAKDRPFTFVDHAIRQGDSLLGVTSLSQISRFGLTSPTGALDRRLGALLGDRVRASVASAAATWREIRSTETIDLTDVDRKRVELQRADLELGPIRALADRLVAIELRESESVDREAELISSADEAARLIDAEGADWAPFIERTRRLLGRSEGISVVRAPLHWPLEFPHVYMGDRVGFDAIVGNPPFLGGKKVSGVFGSDYREYLVRAIAGGMRGNSDLVVFFLLRAAEVGSSDRNIGILATDTIGEGDNREVGLDQLTRHLVIHRAVKSIPWPGSANLRIAKLWLAAKWRGLITLDGSVVPAISPSLTSAGRVEGPALRLQASKKGAFQGSNVLGTGFTLSPEEARRLIGSDHRNADVVLPFLDGRDLNTEPNHIPRRWIIDFREMSEQEARSYVECWALLEERVKPERMTKDAAKYPRMVNEWWKHWNSRPALYERLKGRDEAVVIARVSKFVIPALVPAHQVFHEMVVVFPAGDAALLALLASAPHWNWAVSRSSTMGLGTRYALTDCFETYPMIPLSERLGALGSELHELRLRFMTSESRGLTSLYNDVHEPTCRSKTAVDLRDVHEAIDLAVVDEYGWSDLALNHGFFEMEAGTRFTVEPPIRQELLDRLLELNHERYREEVEQGLHGDAPIQLDLQGG